MTRNLSIEAHRFMNYRPPSGNRELGESEYSYLGNDQHEAEGAYQFENRPTTLRMRSPQVHARILWPALGFPAVISPQKNGVTDPLQANASRCICVLLLSDKQFLGKEEVAAQLRIVPWAQRGRRQIATGQPGTFGVDDIRVLNDQGATKLSLPTRDHRGSAIMFGARRPPNQQTSVPEEPIVVNLSDRVRKFYFEQGLKFLHEIRISEAACAKLTEQQYHLFWMGDAMDGQPSDEMKLLIDRFAVPRRKELGPNWNAMERFLVEEYTFDYGYQHPPYQQSDGQKRFTEVLHPVFVVRQSGPLRVAHITDTHVSVRDDSYEANLVRKGKIGVLPYNNNNRNFEQAYTDAKAESDAILLTGDLVDYGRGHIGPISNGRFLDTLGNEDYYHKDRNWFLLYYLLASANRYTKPTYTILGNHDWRLNPYPPFAPSATTPGEMFDLGTGNIDSKAKIAADLLHLAHGPGDEKKFTYRFDANSKFELLTHRESTWAAIKAFFGDLKQEGSPLLTSIESVLWYLLLINPFLDYAVKLPSGQELLMLDWGEEEELLNTDEPRTWMGFGQRAAESLSGLQKWMVGAFAESPGSAKIVCLHAPVMGVYPNWSDAELKQGVKTYAPGQDSRMLSADRKGPVRVPQHTIMAIRSDDQPRSVAAEHGSIVKERTSLITTLAKAKPRIRLVLSGHIHRAGLFTAQPVQSRGGWLLKYIESQNLRNGQSPGPVYVNTTSAGPRGWRNGTVNVSPGWMKITLHSNGFVESVSPRNIVLARGGPAGVHPELEKPLAEYGSQNYEEPEYFQKPMFLKSFSSRPVTFKFGGLVGGKMHRGSNWRHNRWRRWGGLFGPGSGSSLSSDGSDSILQCLAQVTGQQIPPGRRSGFATRRAIRMFQMQQQLPRTGVLDAATTEALQEACGDQDSDSGGS